MTNILPVEVATGVLVYAELKKRFARSNNKLSHYLKSGLVCFVGKKYLHAKTFCLHNESS